MGFLVDFFCDFGPSFNVSDVDGEESVSGIIAAIANDTQALVYCFDDKKLKFWDGDMVVFWNWWNETTQWREAKKD